MNTATALTGGTHGTKWIGTALALAGAISGVDPAVLPPSWLPWVAGIGGVAALVRGFVNTSNQQSVTRP